MSLQAKQLTIGYANKNLAKELNLKLETGKMICLLGQNGVGKSTLLRTLSGLQPLICGQIIINDQVIENITRNELAKLLGIVTTEKIGLKSMTVQDLVSLGRYPYTNWLGLETDVDRTVINQAIATCKIEYLRYAKLGEISDGQLQKAMIARVLAQNTQYILLDEPTAHLDLVNRVEMFQLLKKISQEDQKGIIVSTHELDLSLQFSDELWLMNFNEPMTIGEPHALVSSGELNRVFHIEGFEFDFSNPKIRLIQSKE